MSLLFPIAANTYVAANAVAANARISCITPTTKISTGLSMIVNGKKFDCVVVDDETFEMDIVHFLRQVLKHLPHIPIIVMAWNDFQVLIAKQTLTNEAIWFLQKPCGVSQICNLLQHVCTRRRINFIEGRTATGKSLKEYQECNTFDGVDNMVNNNISFSNGLIDISINKNKGKKPMELNRENGQPVMDHMYRKRRKDITPRSPWTRALHGKFMEGAYPKANQMSVPGLTRKHVGSHLEIFQERKNNTKKSNLVVPFQKSDNLKVENYACKTIGLSNPSNNDASMIQKSSTLQSPLKLNSTGIAFMTIDNIKAKLYGTTPFNLPELNTTTPINNSDNDLSNHSFGDIFQPLIGEISGSNAFGLSENPHNRTGIETFSNNYALEEALMTLDHGINSTIQPGYTMGSDTNNLSNCFVNGHYGGAGGSGAPESLAQIDRFGIPIDSFDGGVADSSNHESKDSTFQEPISYDLGGLSHPQDYHRKG